MRLTTAQIELICSTAKQLLGERARVTLFGSRVDDSLKGGDVDLLVEVSDAIAEPARLSARLASRISRAMNGRRVDVVLGAPNLLQQPIHEVARQTGVVL
jgi:predicted nucleotidyltransferase